MYLSVIIPVYNVEKYLNQCVDSVLSQLPDDSEIILIDDGSTDKSSQICDLYSEKDSRVRTIHQENRGLSGARNAGLDIAKGNKIFFIDSDDYLPQNYFNTLLSNESDIVIGNYRAFYSDGHPDIIGDFKPANYTDLKDFLNDFNIYFTTIFNFAWGKIYNSNIIKQHNLRFDESLSMVEDVLFNTQYYSYCKNISVVPNAQLCYRQTNNSLSKKQNPLLFSWYSKSYDKIKCLLESHSAFSGNNLICFYSKMFGNILESIFSVRKLSSEQRNKIYTQICNSDNVQKSVNYTSSYKTKGIALAIKSKNNVYLHFQANLYIFLLKVKQILRGFKL